MRKKLDLKDKKLLSVLDFDAKITLGKLAKATGLSKQGAEYRLKSLVARGIIKGFYPVINVPKLGYIYCRLLLTLRDVTRERQREVLASLKADGRVFWLFRMHGPYDLLAVIWARSVTDFRGFIDDVLAQWGKHVKRWNATITTDVIHLQHRYLLGKGSTREIHVRETSERVGVDGTDRRILRHLCKGARASLVSIARELGVSAKVVAYRIRRMEREGIIEAYRPVIDHEALGYTYYKVFLSLNEPSKESVRKLKAHVQASPLVIYIVEGIGMPGDLDMEVMVRSNGELREFIEDLRFRFPALVGEYQTVTFLDTLKVEYFPTGEPS